MKYIEDFKEDDHIVDHYYCKQKQSLKSSKGKTYFSLKLQDKTGVVDAKVWELNNDIQSFDEGDYIKVDGIVLIYQNDKQLKVTKIRKSKEGEYEPTNYIPHTAKDIDTLYAEIVGFINSVSNSYIKQMLENLLVKDEAIIKAFKSRSAAKNMHHSYMGGLIEHTVSVVTLCDFMSTHYKHANRDILIATAIMHDIGKIYELSDFPDNNYTDEGQLIGHIITGAEMITSEAAKIPGFPVQLKNLMKHCILAHHGELEYGSPKVPKTIEAFILHCADNLDAKVKMFEEMLDDSNVQGAWVGYNKMLTRNVRKSDFDE